MNENEVDLSTLAGRLRYARVLSGVSARGLSLLARLSPSHVSLIEAGRGITSVVAGKLTAVLGVSADWLEHGRGEAPSVDVVQAAVALAGKSASVTAEAS